MRRAQARDRDVTTEQVIDAVRGLNADPAVDAVDLDVLVLGEGEDREATETATSIWERINLINLRENILPTRQRADLILKKVESHSVEEVALRRL